MPSREDTLVSSLPAQTCRPSLQLQQTRARSCSATFLFLMLVI